MEKQKFSSSVAAVCTLTLASMGLASCTSVENESAAKLKSVQTVAPLTQTAGVVAPTSVTMANATTVTQSALEPVTVAVQKSGRNPVDPAATAAAAIPVLGATALPADATLVASAAPLTPGLQPGVEYYIIPEHVAVPTPRPGTTFAVSAALNTATPLQQMAETTVAAPQTSTKLADPLTVASTPPVADQTVLVASAQPDQNFFIIPGRVAVPEPRPGSELAYAAAAPGSAAEAIAMQSPAVQPDTLGGVPVQQASVSTTTDPAKPRNLLNDLIFKYSMLYGVPEHFVHRVAKRESTYNPNAYRAGNYGLMQIRLNTAKGLGYKGDAKGLFDAETNLKYAVKYLRGAYMVADGNEDKADKLYIKGFYYEAKKKGLLEETNMK